MRTQATPKTSTAHNDETTPLPVPVEQTPYLCVRPTEEPLSPTTVETHLRRLHQVGRARESPSLLEKLFDQTPNPTIECLIVSGSTERLTYAFGIDPSTENDTLERILRGTFPNTYELERVEWPDNWLESVIPVPDEESLETLAAIEFEGRCDRRRDWQTRLTPYRTFYGDDRAREPLAGVVETMAECSVPMVYQVLLRAKDDWTHDAEERRLALEAQQETLGDQLTEVLFGPPDEDTPIPQPDAERIEELRERDTRRSFAINARLLAVGNEAETHSAITQLTPTFAEVSQTTYSIAGTPLGGESARGVRDAISDATLHPPNYERLRTRLPFTRNRSRGIVADANEAASFCFFGGDALTAAGARAVAPTPAEQIALPRPPAAQLEAYQKGGLRLGNPLTQDGDPQETPIAVPPQLQALHVGWFGKTGSGKSTSLINAMLSNHAATDGASILIDPKGDGMAEEYLRAHSATYGDLDDVVYFDCGETLPAFSFFDIRDELAAGVPRTTAVEDTVDHYVEILMQVMGAERFEQAVRSPDIIRYLTKAMFDPIQGEDAFSHRDLHEAVQRMRDRQSAPAVSDDDLERLLAGVVANRPRSFDEIMQGVANRIEKIPIDQRLAKMFDHVAREGSAGFDLAEYLDEDVVIVFETGDLRSEAQRVFTLVVLSNLWTALRRRSRQLRKTADETSGDVRENTSEKGDLPLVNLYVEEAASIAVTDLLKELLAQSRGFGCSVTLAMQFPAQLRQFDDEVYDEVLNNISTFVTGNVPVDRRLARRLATDEMPPEKVGTRLRALRRGQWLVRLPAEFDAPVPRPFLVQSAPLPPGHPAGERPFTPAEERAFQSDLDAILARTRSESGITLDLPHRAQETEESAAGEESADQQSIRPVASALAHTKRMPPTVEYHEETNALRCRECDNRYDPTATGMERAISCCGSLSEVDRDDIPVCETYLKLTSEERQSVEWTDTQLLFVQAVYNAQQLRYDPLEYDLLRDSMLRLQEYVGIETEAIDDLLDAELIRHDTDHPHRLYSVTAEGRSAVGESYRQGVDYGHGKGDLEESSQHVMAVEVGRQYLVANYRENPDSPVEQVVTYYELSEQDEPVAPADAFMGTSSAEPARTVDEYDQRRLDAVGLDSEGGIVVAVEAERINHDVREAIPADFDKMAVCSPDEAIWIVMKQSAGHDVLSALNDPPDDVPRVEKTYAKTTPPQQFRIDTPGMTAVYPVEWLRDQTEASDESPSHP